MTSVLPPLSSAPLADELDGDIPLGVAGDVSDQMEADVGAVAAATDCAEGLRAVPVPTVGIEAEPGGEVTGVVHARFAEREGAGEGAGDMAPAVAEQGLVDHSPVGDRDGHDLLATDVRKRLGFAHVDGVGLWSLTGQGAAAGYDREHGHEQEHSDSPHDVCFWRIPTPPPQERVPRPAF
ncbi:MAG: hypothetical protein M3415_01070 [Actinomycetota bacterium]|nr:hypothetical protein [Actinomycetota bacterium]